MVGPHSSEPVAARVGDGGASMVVTCPARLFQRPLLRVQVMVARR
jgi:hypothetical protein